MFAEIASWVILILLALLVGGALCVSIFLVMRPRKNVESLQSFEPVPLFMTGIISDIRYGSNILGDVRTVFTIHMPGQTIDAGLPARESGLQAGQIIQFVLTGESIAYETQNIRTEQEDGTIVFVSERRVYWGVSQYQIIGEPSSYVVVDSTYIRTVLEQITSTT